MATKSSGELFQDLIDATHACANEAREDQKKARVLAVQIERNTWRIFVFLLWVFLFIPLGVAAIYVVYQLQTQTAAEHRR